MAMCNEFILICWIILIIVFIIVYIYCYYESITPIPADKIFYNGSIVTMECPYKVLNAIAIRNGLIAKVGSKEDVMEFKGDDTVLIDLEGKAVLPGFISSSNFPFQGYFTNFFIDLSPPPFLTDPSQGVTTVAQILERLEEEIQNTPEDEWIVGAGYDPNFLDRDINRFDLDTLGSSNPIWILYRTGDAGVANSVALERAGISDNPATPNLPGGRIIRTENEVATGLLLMTNADLVNNIIPVPTFEENIEGGIVAAELYSSQGVTTVLNAHSNQLIMQFLNGLSRLNLVKNRIVLYPNFPTTERISSNIFKPKPEPKVTVGATSMTVDGSIQYYTAFLQEPYMVSPPYNERGIITEDDEYFGFLGARRETFRRNFLEIHQDGKQVALYTNGSEGLQFAIDTIREAQLVYPNDKARHILVHSLDVTENQLNEIKRLPVVVSFFSNSLYYWGDFYKNKYLGQDRSDDLSPIKSVIEKDIIYSIHTYSPSTPINMMELIQNTVTRETLSGDVLGSDQKISIFEALKGITINAAFTQFMEDILGTLTQNKVADLVILSKNPLNVAPQNLDKIEILETIVEGETIYKKCI